MEININYNNENNNTIPNINPENRGYWDSISLAFSSLANFFKKLCGFEPLPNTIVEQISPDFYMVVYADKDCKDRLYFEFDKNEEIDSLNDSLIRKDYQYDYISSEKNDDSFILERASLSDDRFITERTKNDPNNETLDLNNFYMDLLAVDSSFQIDQNNNKNSDNILSGYINVPENFKFEVVNDSLNS